jgi:hypothetical protein
VRDGAEGEETSRRDTDLECLVCVWGRRGRDQGILSLGLRPVAAHGEGAVGVEVWADGRGSWVGWQGRG